MSVTKGDKVKKLIMVLAACFSITNGYAQNSAKEEKIARNVPLKLSGMCAGYFSAAADIDKELSKKQGGKPQNADIIKNRNFLQNLFQASIKLQDPNKQTYWMSYFLDNYSDAMKMGGIELGPKLGSCGDQMSKYFN